MNFKATVITRNGQGALRFQIDVLGGTDVHLTGHNGVARRPHGINIAQGKSAGRLDQ